MLFKSIIKVVNLKVPIINNMRNYKHFMREDDIAQSNFNDNYERLKNKWFEEIDNYTETIV